VIPDPVTLGHVLMLLGVLAALLGLWQLSVFLRHRGHGRGTPLYARARDGRRFGIVALALGALLYVAGCFTPLAEIAIAGGGG
jgi:uncharacterized membrane protein YiaA